MQILWTKGVNNVVSNLIEENWEKVSIHSNTSSRQLTQPNRSTFSGSKKISVFRCFLNIFSIFFLNSPGKHGGNLFFIPAFSNIALIGLRGRHNHCFNWHYVEQFIWSFRCLQPRFDFLLAFLKLLWLAWGWHSICLLVTDWPKGCLHHSQGTQCLFWHIHTHTNTHRNHKTLTHTPSNTHTTYSLSLSSSPWISTPCSVVQTHGLK